MVLTSDRERGETTKNSIIYILSKNNDIDGRMKLMKLMFLLEHYNLKKQKLTVEKRIGNNFIIYRRGVFSFEVYKSFLRLVKNKIIEEDRSLGTNFNVKEIQEKVPNELLNDINIIISKFGKLSGIDLELKTLNMLNITKEEKSEYFGLPVEVLISKL
jgi:hypothetical protein